MDHETILTDEVKRLVGYIMPVIEILGVDAANKSTIKGIIWKFKDDLVKTLDQEKLNKEKLKNDNRIHKAS